MSTLFRLLMMALFILASSQALLAQNQYSASFGGNAGFQAPLWAASDLGFFDQYGLKVELVRVRGGARGMQALIGGSTEFAQMDGTPVIHAARQNTDVVVIAGALNTLPYSFVTNKEIRTPSDLRGKKIGIVNFGGTNELSVLMALKRWNVDPKSVTMIASGPTAQRLAALQKGALDATVLTPPVLYQPAVQKLNVLADLAEMKSIYPMTVVAVQPSFLKEHRATVKQFLKAYIAGLHQFISDQKKGMQVYKKRLNLSDTAVLDKTYRYFSSKFSDPPQVDRQGFATVVEMVQSLKGKGKTDVNLDKILDPSLLDELEQEGFFKQLK